jgi:hypothetical protein
MRDNMTTPRRRFTDVEFLALHDAAEALDCDHEGLPHEQGCDELPRLLRDMLTESKSTPESEAKFRCAVAKAIASVAHSGCTKIEGHEGPCDDALLCKHCGEEIENSRYGYRHVLTRKITCGNGLRRPDGGLRSAEPSPIETMHDA